MKSPCSLLFSRLNNCNFLSLTSWESCSSSLIIFLALLWTGSSRFTSFLCWGFQSWMLHSTCGLMRAGSRRRSPSFNLLGTVLWVQPNHWQAVLKPVLRFLEHHIAWNCWVPCHPFNAFIKLEAKALLQEPLIQETVLSDLMAKCPNGSARNWAALPLGPGGVNLNLVLRYKSSTLEQSLSVALSEGCLLHKSLKENSQNHAKSELFGTVHGMDCFLRKTDFIAQQQNYWTRHVFILEGIKPSTMKFYRKCSTKVPKLRAVRVR